MKNIEREKSYLFYFINYINIYILIFKNLNKNTNNLKPI